MVNKDFNADDTNLINELSSPKSSLPIKNSDIELVSHQTDIEFVNMIMPKCI